ncbi:hypothetical protein F5Y16DRAFT_424231 [Xylariaceae sp. FL0255]|nr:hypothetical protein F5Y16DRAFT_424231 [Xylariaceae sp. FL0255]
MPNPINLILTTLLFLQAHVALANFCFGHQRDAGNPTSYLDWDLRVASDNRYNPSCGDVCNERIIQHVGAVFNFTCHINDDGSGTYTFSTYDYFLPGDIEVVMLNCTNGEQVMCCSTYGDWTPSQGKRYWEDIDFTHA